jgi:hypothetical protein
MDKVSVTFVTADGESETVQAPIGISLMQAEKYAYLLITLEQLHLKD